MKAHSRPTHFPAPIKEPLSGPISHPVRPSGKTSLQLAGACDTRTCATNCEESENGTRKWVRNADRWLAEICSGGTQKRSNIRHRFLTRTCPKACRKAKPRMNRKRTQQEDLEMDPLWGPQCGTRFSAKKWTCQQRAFTFAGPFLHC